MHWCFTNEWVGADAKNRKPGQNEREGKEHWRISVTDVQQLEKVPV